MDKILGVRIDRYSISEVLEIVKKTVETNKKLQIVTLNTELLVASQKDKRLKEVINKSDLNLPESSGLYLADNYFASELRPNLLRLISSGFQTIFGSRKGLSERVAGVDLSYRIVDLCSKHGYKLLLLGGKEGVATTASKNLKKLYPKLEVVGSYGGAVASEEEKILGEVEKADPDIIFVAFGQPNQEYWIAENLGKTSAKVAVGVGGTLDFMAGRVVRAPKWVRNLGLEWVFRLLIQPWRIKRQLALLKFIKILLSS